LFISFQTQYCGVIVCRSQGVAACEPVADLGSPCLIGLPDALGITIGIAPAPTFDSVFDSPSQ
jgi:hypothetical protein